MVTFGQLAYGQVQSGAPVIGVAQAWGAFSVSDASVPGSASLFDGTCVRTGDASSDVKLAGGERVTMYSNSSATVYAGNLLLTRGTAEFSGTVGYRVEARGLHIGSTDSSTYVRVELDRGRRVMVSALGGPAEIRNAEDHLVARVPPGYTLTLAAKGR